MPVKSIGMPVHLIGITVLVITVTICIYYYLNKTTIHEHFETMKEKTSNLKANYTELQKKYRQNIQEEITTSSELETLKKKMGIESKGKISEGNKVRLYEYDMEKVQAALNNINLEVNALKSYYESLQKTYIKTGKDLDTLKEEYALDKEKCAVVDTSLAKSKTDFSKLEKDVVSATSTVNELKKQLGLLTAKSDPLAATLTPVLQDRQKEKLAIDKKLAETGAKLKAELATAEQLKKKLKLDEDKLVELTKQRSLGELQLVKTKAKFNAGSQEKTKLENELKQLNNSITVNDSINKKLQDDINNLRSKYNKVVKEELGTTEKIVAARTKTVNQSIEIKKLQDTIESIKKEKAKAAAANAGFDVRTISGLQIWLDAKDPLNNGSVPAGGTSISKWMDKSGNGNDATANGGSKPTFNDNSIVFNGSNNSFNTPYSANIPQQTAFVIIKINDTSRQNDILGPGGPGDIEYLTTGGNVGLTCGNGINFFLTNGGPINKDLTLLGFSHTSSTVNFYTNGSLIIANKGNYTTSGGGKVNIGAYYGGQGGFLSGSISEIILYNAILSDVDREKVEGYLAKKWGLQAILPVGHPGKGPAAPVEYNPSFMVLGGDNVLAYTKDGKTATVSKSGTAIFSNGNAPFCIGFNGKQWVAAGGGDNWYLQGEQGTKLAISNDGMNWTKVTSMDKLGGQYGIFSSILWTGTKWLLTSNYVVGKNYSSTDGVKWTVITVAGNINQFAGNDSILVGCGTNVQGSAHAIWYSKDEGATWAFAPSADQFFAVDGGGLASIAYNKKLFVAVGNKSASGAEGTIIYSSDGVNWTKASMPLGPKTGRFFSISWGGKMWFAWGQYNACYYSTDGINWQTDKRMPDMSNEHFMSGPNNGIRIPANTAPGCNPIYDGTSWHAMSYYQNSVYSTNDLLNWMDPSCKNTGLSSVFASGAGRAIASAKVLPW